MKFARWLFLIAGILGLMPVLHVLYVGFSDGEAVLPDFGGMGLLLFVILFQAICWQVMYLFLALDPGRYRPLMALAFFVELSTAFNTLWLYFYGYRVWISFVAVHLTFAALFLVAFGVTARRKAVTAG